MCVSKVPIFNHLTADEMATIATCTHYASVNKGESLATAGELLDQLFIVHRGKVKIYRLSPIGKEQIVRILTPGDFFGEYGLFDDQPQDNYAEALEQTEVCVIRGEDFQRLLEQFPQMALKLLREMSKRLAMSERLIEQLSLHSVEQRLAATLLELAHTTADTGQTLTLDISKGELSNYLGMSQETLSRTLSSFQQRGWIQLVGRRQMVILNEERLKEVIHAS